jgi:hypothetical protein
MWLRAVAIYVVDLNEERCTRFKMGCDLSDSALSVRAMTD